MQPKNKTNNSIKTRMQPKNKTNNSIIFYRTHHSLAYTPDDVELSTKNVEHHTCRGSIDYRCDDEKNVLSWGNILVS